MIQVNRWILPAVALIALMVLFASMNNSFIRSMIYPAPSVRVRGNAASLIRTTRLGPLNACLAMPAAVKLF